MAKKKIIISRKQLKKLNEVELSVQATQNTSGAYADAVNNSNTQGDLKNLKGSTGSDPAAIISGPTTTDKSPVVDVNVPAGMSPSSVMNNSQEIGNAINGGAAARIHGDGFPMESVKYTKKQLEETRLNNIKKNGTVYTKKSLRESIFSPALSAVEWGDGLKKYINEFITNINNDQELQNYLMRPGEFSECLHEVMKTAQQLLMDLDELSNVRP